MAFLSPFHPHEKKRETPEPFDPNVSLQGGAAKTFGRLSRISTRGSRVTDSCVFTCCRRSLPEPAGISFPVQVVCQGLLADACPEHAGGPL
jgi:hypothetical protein